MYTVSVLLVPPLLLDYASSLGRSVLLAPYAYRHRDEVARLWAEHRGKVLGVAALNPLAYILVLTALAFTPVSYVAPAREVSVLIAVVMGAKLLGEGDLGRRLRWSVIIVLGMVILALG